MTPRKINIDCRYGTDCRSTTCPFKHPNKLCRYGADCNIATCLLRHPNELCGRHASCFLMSCRKRHSINVCCFDRNCSKKHNNNCRHLRCNALENNKCTSPSKCTRNDCLQRAKPMTHPQFESVCVTACTCKEWSCDVCY